MMKVVTVDGMDRKDSLEASSKRPSRDKSNQADIRCSSTRSLDKEGVFDCAASPI